MNVLLRSFMFRAFQVTPRCESGSIAIMGKNPATKASNYDAGHSPEADRQRIRVAVLALPQVLALDFGIPTQVLGRNCAHLYQVDSCSEGGAPVSAVGGFSIAPDRDLDLLAEVDTIIIPGFTQSQEPVSAAVIAALQEAHARGTRMVSICTGAFALAQAGILQGLRATTHWVNAPALAQAFPDVEVDENVLFVDNGNVLTSAGVAAGIDLCLHLVKIDWGVAQGNLAARHTVAAPRREGSQAQFIEQKRKLSPTLDSQELDPVMAWAREHLQLHITVATMATKAAMSQRTLSRKFHKQLNQTPMKWLTAQRIEKAKELLETSTLSVESIASEVALGTASNFRQLFKTFTSLTPTQYRNAFYELNRFSESHG